MDLWWILIIVLVIAAIAFGFLIYYIKQARERMRLKFKADLDYAKERKRLIKRYKELTLKMGIPPPKFEFFKYTTKDIKNAVDDLETEAIKRPICIKCGTYMDTEARKCWKCGSLVKTLDS
jgi:ribosomal protein L40E